MQPAEIEAVLLLMRRHGVAKLSTPELTVEMGPDPGEVSQRQIPSQGVPRDVLEALQRLGYAQFAKSTVTGE